MGGSIQVQSRLVTPPGKNMSLRRLGELIAYVALIVSSTAAQSADLAKPCDAKEFRAFDFWIGEWRVTWKTPQGQPAQARNSIRRVLDGCAIEEHWQGDDGSEGKSLTFFDPAAKRWHQTYVDKTAQPLMLEGNFENESLVLTGKYDQGGGFTTFHKITWTPLAGGVRQHWQQSANGRSWDTVFDGTYERVDR
jgi:hypothetical protein